MFEVSLVRVIEETGTVEVLWDRGVKREFKWGSLILGETDPSQVTVIDGQTRQPASGWQVYSPAQAAGAIGPGESSVQ